MVPGAEAGQVQKVWQRQGDFIYFLFYLYLKKFKKLLLTYS